MSRTVYINDDPKSSNFFSNYISTTKYSLLTLIPLFLIEQFSRFSNAYFLIVGISYTIDTFSPVFTFGRYSTLWVLAVVVAISGIKEFVEDFHRYREDKRLNESPATIVGTSERNRWASVHVGDILKVHDREHLPADIVLVATSNDDGLAYIDTNQLDGESDLKVKAVPPAVNATFSSESSALLTSARIECEAPNARLYKFNGHTIHDKVSPRVQSMILEEVEVDASETLSLNEPIPVGPENLLIRGSSVRNTE